MSPLITYQEKAFRAGSLRMIEHAIAIIEEYQAEGYSLTLRQLYYQFVARDLIPNRVREYKRLGGIVNDARLAGLIDWEAIEDRTRNLEEMPHWNDPAHIIRSCVRGFQVDRWEDQPYRVEVWIEKEALAGVFERVCEELDVPYLSCRGYTSQSEMWAAAQRLIDYHHGGQRPVILHFGDHDPSGIDMTRDIADRMEMFGAPVRIERLALNMDQVDEWSPPPNPAKTTDSRFEGYLLRYGNESWELDALEPRVLASLVRDRIMALVDEDAWEEADERIREGRRLLRLASQRWHEITALLEGGR